MKNMMYVILAIAFVNLFAIIPPSPGYQVGDVIADFSAMDVTRKTISTKDFETAKGFVIVFTCNTCPVAQKYEQRIIQLAEKLNDKEWPLIAINSNDEGMSPGDSFDKMQSRAKSKKYSFPYLHDESQSIVNAFGATKTPHFYVLDANKKIKYIGALDDNAEDVSAIKTRYVENAIGAIEKNQDPNPSFTRAVGCGIKKRTT
jgi:peroxiredoxin